MGITGICVVIYRGKPIGYISVPAFAKKCGVKPATIRVWINRKKIETLKIGKEQWIKGDTKKPERKKVNRNNNKVHSEE